MKDVWNVEKKVLKFYLRFQLYGITFQKYPFKPNISYNSIKLFHYFKIFW